MAIKHLKWGYHDGGTEFLFYLNVNVNKHVCLVVTILDSEAIGGLF